MAIVTGDRYLEKLVKFVEEHAGPLIEGTVVLKLNPAGLHYVQSRLEALHELESMLAGAPVDYLRAYVSDLGDHRALEQLRRILRLLTSLKVVSVLPPPIRDPTPLSFLPFGRLKVLELRGCDLSTSAARALLDLRHTLEKIICHNSTDALRHVFASRITEIKDSPQWNRLSFVSCACNALVLMDESLQLLPAVETLDLSRNKFAKVDNLHKCAKLKHLDLGFNHLRSFAPFTQLKLDDKEMSTEDFWKRQIIIASMHKQPASFGIYVPAKDESTVEAGNNRRRKVIRLASIKNEEVMTSSCSDEESASCVNEILNREEPDLSNDEAEVVDLINKVEHMKKERSILWLREFKEWMDIACDKSVGTSKEARTALHHQKKHYFRDKTNQEKSGEVSRYASDSALASGDESSMNILESDNSFVDMCRQQYFDYRGSHFTASLSDLGGVDVDQLKSYSLADTVADQRAYRMAENVNISPLTTINGVYGSQSSSVCPSSPPHFQEDLFHRRQHMEEEILQLSADSFSVASSDSNTSGSEVDHSEFEPPVPGDDNLLSKNYVNGNVNGHVPQNQPKDMFYNPSQGIPHAIENGISLFGSLSDENSKQCSINFAASSHNDANTSFVSEDADSLTRKVKKKVKKRFVSILEENTDGSASQEQEQISQGPISGNLKNELHTDDSSEFSVHNSRAQENDDFIVTYFNSSVADSEASEICSHCMRCSCVIQREAIYIEREVAVLLSSLKKLYVLLINVASEGSGTLSVLSCHKVEEVFEVLVGMGLQLLRVNFEGGETYLFVTRNIEKSRELLCNMLDSCVGNGRCSIKSLEQVQVQLFDNLVCGGSNVSIYQYSMVLVSCNNSNEKSWVSRSLFVIKGYVLLCIEDVKQLFSLSSDSSVSPYFRVESCCSIPDITKVVIEVGESCVTLVLTYPAAEFRPSTQMNLEAVNQGNSALGPLKLKLKWFCKDNLLKFVSLLKAIHAEKMVCPLVVRCSS
ncbi:uncharacterized protein LOC107631745 isoform X2 [Arachis ipaensis]|uniref:uncharacterized protein LOC107631745 isoform X2 n=1 Tax=Arachis ipaensis TaxID=130454 RepID=UPI000A2B3325|nr:uncharacterized protein LOC107631745 isoform X2 [Arachis ipaensis]